ncbi:RibD family protein [Gemmatimonadota bacterium]
MAVSLDGKIAPADRQKMRLGGSADLELMEALRAWADVIIVGAGTIRAEDPPFALTDEVLRRRRLDEGRTEHPMVVVLTAGMRLDKARVFSGPGRAIIATTDQAPDPGPEVPERVTIWRLGQDGVDVMKLVERIASEGYDRILVEGGGRAASLFFEMDLVDEIRLTLTPWLIGGDGAPSLADAGRLFDAPPVFHLISNETIGDEVFLIYRKGVRGESIG